MPVLENTAALVFFVVTSIWIFQSSVVRYEAGTEDHLVISPAGMRLADKSLFINDYFVLNAKQPHWLFEVITAIGEKINNIGLVYFLYWIATLAVFGFANILLATHLTKQRNALLGVFMGLLQIAGARVFFGTSAVVLNQALPHSMGASLAFLAIVLFITDRRPLLSAILPLVPLVHIQIGTILAVLLAPLIVFPIARGGRGLKPNRLQISLLVTCFVIFASLRYRQAAGNLPDFSLFCRELAPHHCFAPSWSHGVMAGSYVILALGLIGGLSSGTLSNSSIRRIVIFGLPTLALAVGLWIDRNEIHALTNFVRGTNLYRIAVVLTPFLYWTPIMNFRLAVISSGRKRYLAYIRTVLCALLVVQFVTMSEQGSLFESRGLLAASFVLGTLLVSIKDLLPNFRTLRTTFSASLSVGLIATVINTAPGPFALPNVRFEPDPNTRAFGEALARDTSPGQVVAGDPQLVTVRMASGRAYAVDCKFRPLGGGPPLYEYLDRVQILGGWKSACQSGTFMSLDASQLLTYTQRGAADLLMLTCTDSRSSELVSSNWKRRLSPHLEEFSYCLWAPPT